MPKRSRKPRDLNRLAASIVSEATDEAPSESETPAQTNGRRGGLKGGTARAQKLSAAERSAIAKKAARARWEGQT